MPTTCIVVGCGSRSNRDKVSFHAVPSILNHRFLIHLNELSAERRLKWLAAIKRDDLTDTKLKYEKVCSKHFITGKPASLENKNHPDWIPTQYMGHTSNLVLKTGADVERVERLVKRKKIKLDENAAGPSMQTSTEDLSVEDPEPESGVSVQTDLTFLDLENQFKNSLNLNERINNVTVQLNKLSFKEESFKDDNEKTLFYTGLSFPLLKIVLETIQPYLSSHTNNVLDPFSQLLLTLMKLRLNLSFRHLSYSFGISATTASACFEKTIEIMSKMLKSLIVWPSREMRNKNIPFCFKEVFHDKTTVIIDCFEIFIQKPSNLLTQQQCWSNYKHHYTIKFLIGITPQGTVSYISNTWGGRISDKQIVQYSTFLNNINPQDIILADRGFLINDMVGILQAKVGIPAFTKGKKQLHPIQIEETRQIAHVRIHVERIIGMIKTKFQIFKEIIPISMLSNISNNESILDKIIIVCCALINLSPPIIPL